MIAFLIICVYSIIYDIKLRGCHTPYFGEYNFVFQIFGIT